MVQHTAIVSGGNTGIGAAIARGLLAEGYDVISLSRRKPDWSQPKLTSREVDLLDATATRQAAAEIAAKVAITHVVHNAGAIRAKLLEEVADEDVGALAQLHFGAAIALAQAALPGMKQARFGRIVLLSSRAALGAATRTVYSATKGAITAFTRSLSQNLIDKNIRVNAVAPGPIWTPLNPSGGQPPEKIPDFGKDTPMGRPGQPNEAAPPFLFLACEDSSYMAGQVLHPNGGTVVNG